MIVFPSYKARSKGLVIAPISGIARVGDMTILGIFIDNNLSVSILVSNTCQTSAQCLYGIKLVKGHGLDPQSIFD